MRYRLIHVVAATDIKKGEFCEYLEANSPDSQSEVQPFRDGRRAGFAIHDANSGEALALVIKSMFFGEPILDGHEWEGWIPPGGDAMYFDVKGYVRRRRELMAEELQRRATKRANFK